GHPLTGRPYTGNPQAGDSSTDSALATISWETRFRFTQVRPETKSGGVVRPGLFPVRSVCIASRTGIRAEGRGLPGPARRDSRARHRLLLDQYGADGASEMGSQGFAHSLSLPRKGGAESRATLGDVRAG